MSMKIDVPGAPADFALYLGSAPDTLEPIPNVVRTGDTFHCELVPAQDRIYLSDGRPVVPRG